MLSLLTWAILVTNHVSRALSSRYLYQITYIHTYIQTKILLNVNFIVIHLWIITYNKFIPFSVRDRLVLWLTYLISTTSKHDAPIFKGYNWYTPYLVPQISLVVFLTNSFFVDVFFVKLFHAELIFALKLLIILVVLKL